MIKRLLSAVAMLCAVSGAQTPVTPIVQPHVTFVNSVGAPCAGCSLYTYVAGTTTLLATYTDSTGTVQNTNPIVLDASGGPHTPTSSAGGIWVGRTAYKFVLKDPLGATIWTVDNVTQGNLFPCGPAGSVQFSNTGVTGMDCDSAIFINKANHTLNVGTIGANHVVIGALGTPTLWTFDTTTPATALASLGGSAGGTVGSAASIPAIPYYAALGNALTATSAIPNGITATTQAPDDDSGKVATTAYVTTPGGINPTSVQIGTGATLTGNQGSGEKIQHSTGTTTTNNCAKFDASGNLIDSGVACGGAVTRTCNANGCYKVDADGTIEQWGVSSAFPTGADTSSVTVTFPTSFTTTANLSFVAWADNCADSACSTKTPVSITGNGSGASTTSVVVYASGVVPTGGGGAVLNNTIHVHWQAKGN